LRVTAARNVSPPLVALHEGPPAATTGLTVTVTDWLALPPEPLQVRAYVWLLVREPVLKLPLIPLLPDQPPEALQLVALVDDQLSVEDEPLLMLPGLAVRLTVGGGGADTLTVTDLLALPPDPLQVSV